MAFLQSVWILEFIADTPACYLSEGGKPTFQIAKAKRFESQAVADAELSRLKLDPRLWAPCLRILPSKTLYKAS